MAPTARLVIPGNRTRCMLRFPHDEARSPRALAVPGCAAQTGPTIDVRDLSNIWNNERRFKDAGPPARISASRDARGWAANSTITIVSRRENSRVPPKRRPVATYANPTRPKPGQTSSLSHWMMRTQVGSPLAWLRSLHGNRPLRADVRIFGPYAIAVIP
jgi:hypothetical protein